MGNTTNFCNQLSNAATTRNAVQELKAFADECTQEYLTYIVERYFKELKEVILNEVQKGNYTVENGKRIVTGSWGFWRVGFDFEKEIPPNIYDNLNEKDIKNFNTLERYIDQRNYGSPRIHFKVNVSDKKIMVEHEYYVGRFIKRKKKKSIQIGQPCFNGLSKQFFAALSNRASKEGIELLPEIAISGNGFGCYDYSIPYIKFDNPMKISLQAINNSEQYVDFQEIDEEFSRTNRLQLKKALCEMYISCSEITFRLTSIHYRVVF